MLAHRLLSVRPYGRCVRRDRARFGESFRQRASRKPAPGLERRAAV